MLVFIKRLFIWWHAATLGTSLTLWQRRARRVGTDVQGNIYFEEAAKPSFSDGRRRRWVVYHGVAEASRVPPDWHGWLHHTFDAPPTTEPLPAPKFELPYLPNMTGTALAYRPKGSLARAAEGAKIDDSYEAWSPESA